MNITCLSCSSNNLEDIGKILQSNVFAGNVLDNPLPNSNLLKCVKCGLYFKWPRPEREQLNKLYQSGNPENWRYELNNRKDYQISLDYIREKNIVEGTILDIGCWDGSFLMNLRDQWELYGIEINSIAANNALAKGIKVICDDFSRINFLKVRFDVATAFDVIEHVENPLALILLMSQLTKKNGYIIISSGNTDSLTWKIMGSKYWYCSLPEHISFINPKWCHFAGNKLHLKVEYIERFSHTSVNFLSKMVDFAKNGAYLIMPHLFEKVRKIKHYYYKKHTSNITNYPPSWRAKDHLIVIYRKL